MNFDSHSGKTNNSLENYHWTQILDLLPDGIMVIDKEHTVIFANSAMAKLLDMPQDGFVNKKCFDLIHGRDCSPGFCPHAKLLADGEEHQAEIFENQLNMYCQVSVTPVYGPSQKMIGSIHIIRDINIQKQAEAALKKSEKKYRHLVENINVGMILFQDMKIVFANHSICQFLGYTLDELLTLPNPFEIIHPDDLEAVFQNILKRFRGEEVEETYPFRVVDKQGCTKWVESTNSLTDWKGHPASLNFFIDITDRVESEQRQRHLENQLFQAQKLETMGILAGGIAHDFNNLLSVILGNIQLAQLKVNAGEDAKKFFKAAEEMCKKSKHLTSRIITFSEAGLQNKKQGAIEKLVKEVLADRDTHSCFKYKCKIAPELPLVEFDKNHMKQLLNNLFDNAVEAMPDGGEIEISIQVIESSHKDEPDYQFGTNTKMIKLSVKDHGKGIFEEQVGKIFDPYYSTKPMGKVKGRGLGLTMVYFIIKKHNGSIHVKSSPGAGSVFIVYLPVNDTQIPENDHAVTPCNGKGSMI